MNKIANYFTLAYICDQAETAGGKPTSGVEIVSKKDLPSFQPGSTENVAHQGHLERRGDWAGTEIFELICDGKDEKTWITVLKQPTSFHEEFNEGNIREIWTASGWCGDERDSGVARGDFIILEIKENALIKEGRNIVHFLEHELNYRTPGFIFCVLDDSLNKQD